MTHGGKRNGAGRPKGFSAKTAEEGRAYILRRVQEELEPIITKQIEQAKDGDVASRKDLMDRAYGRPKETVEVQGEMTLKIDV